MLTGSPDPTLPSQEAEALRESRLRAKAIKAKAFIDRVDHVAERNDARKVRAPPRPAPTVAPHHLSHARAIEPRALTSHRKSTRVFCKPPKYGALAD